MTQQRLTGTVTDLAGHITAQDVLVDVTAPPVGGWPHEPRGLLVVTDWGMDQPLPANAADQTIVGSPGWHSVYNFASPGAGATLVADATAPYSPPNVYRFKYPQGFVAGSAPCTLYRGPGRSLTRLYSGFWWKPSNPWTGGPGNTNKLYFVYTTGGELVYEMTDQTRNGVLGFRTRVVFYPGSKGLVENVGDSWPLVLGAWHRFECLSDITAGTLQWWFDGVLVGSYSGLGYASTAYTNLKISPTWGGVGGSVPQDQYFWYDHLYISGA